jgi:F0F1-type ATP synthase, subunit b
MLDINITLLIQLVNFIVTLAVLDFLLIKPIRGIIRKRRDLASGMLSDAETFTTEAAQKLEEYEAALAKAREEAALAREAFKNEAHVAENTILENARKDAQDFLTASREETRTAIAQAMADMDARIPNLARLAVNRLLGKSARSSAS